MTATTLVITNDFPPSLGGIEAFVAQLCDHLDSEVVVLTREMADSDAFDARSPYPIVRTGRVLLPTPAVAARAERLLDEHHITRVLYGAAAPLGLLAPRLARRGVRQVALTHGHEVWWATLPGSRQLLRRISRHTQLTHISDYTSRRLGPAVADPTALRRLPPPVDLERFRPDPTRRPLRPTVLAAGRLIHQKGFDTLLDAWRLVLERWNDPTAPHLIIVGDGPQRRRLERRATDLPPGSVTFVGGVPHAEMPRLFQQAHVFALPMRTRLAGLNAEGLGLVLLEAAASGLPVLAGRSGGAPETVREGDTGFVVDPGAPDQLADRLLELLTDPQRAAALGDAGRRFVAENFSAEAARRTLRELLDL